jgi:hypothetical protein
MAEYEDVGFAERFSGEAKDLRRKRFPNGEEHW